MKEDIKFVYSFLERLAKNNNKIWFDAHKEEYLKAKVIFEAFTMELVARISQWDEYIASSPLSVKDCTYRIYRDIRFSADKTPYKTHIGAFIVRGGKKAPYAGYYFHLEPPQKRAFIGGSMMFAGLYQPLPKVVASVRDEISVNGDSLLSAIKKATGFALSNENAYKRIPTGFDGVENESWRELLKLRDFGLSKAIDERYLFSTDNLAKKAAADFAKCAEFNLFLNKCVDYALDDNNGLNL